MFRTCDQGRLAGRVVFAALIVCWMAADADAQGNRRQVRHQQPQQQGAGTPIDLEGSFVAFRNGVIEIENGLQKEKWQCKPAQSVVVIAKAEAPADFLQKGTYISFTAEVNLKKGTIEEPISEVTIFIPGGKAQPGVFLPEHAAELYISQDDMKIQQQMASMGGGGMGGMGAMGMGGMAGMGMDSMMPAEPGEKKSRKKEKPPETMTLVVRGMIKTLSKAGALVLTVPPNVYTKPAIKGKIADEPAIEAVLTGRAVFEYAKKGDKVAVSGNHMTQFGPTMMQLTYMNVEFSGPLEKPGKKKATKKSAKDDEDE